MTVQFNLLPDVKIQYIKAHRQKQLVLFISTISVIASVVILILLVSIVFVVQKKSISDLSRDISASSDELQSTPDLTKMLTVQNQLRSLPSLHASKPVASRIFGYMNQSTPSDVSISRLNVDFAQNTMTISGSAASLETVNKFVDTLKFTTFHTESASKDERPSFKDVVLAAFGRDSKGASYSITLAFDPVIFSEAEQVTLTVPNKITTRSQIEQPAALFQGQGGGQ